MKRDILIAVLACVLLSFPAAGQVVLSSYFGGPGADRMTAAAIASDGTIYIGGTMPGAELKPSARVPKQEGNGDGVLIRLTSRGDKVLSVVRFEGSIEDLDADAEGSIYVTGGFGSAKLNSPTAERLWTSPLGGQGARIAAGPNGRSVILLGKTICVVGPAGKISKSWEVDAQHVNDVACDVKNKLIFVTGFNNRRGTPPGQKNYPVQVAFVHAYDEEGKKVWTAYDWKGQQVADLHLMADTRGYRLAMGLDGKLYLAGESAGGNTIWSRKSQDLRANLPLAKGDKYQVAYNTGANHITFVGRLDPKTGNVEAGTMLLARLASGRGNTIRPRALAADASGKVYVGGVSAYAPPVSPVAFGGDFDGGGAFFCAFDRNFKRVYATKFCSGTTAAIAVGDKSLVAVGDGTENLKTVEPLQSEPGGGKSDGWAAVFASKP